MSQFWDRIASEYNAGVSHQFLLHFNVEDLVRDEVCGYLPMFPYLMEQLNALGCDFVIGYTPSQGVIWPDVNQWKVVQKWLGLLPYEEQQDDGSRAPINSKVHHWKLNEDAFLTGKHPPSDEVRENLDALLHEGRAKVGLVINFVEKIVPNTELTALDKESSLFLDMFQEWAGDFDIRMKKNVVLLMTQNLADVHPTLVKQSEIPTIEIPFPDYNERLEFIKYLINVPIPSPPPTGTQITKSVTLAPGFSVEQLARDTSGLNLFGIHDVALRAEEAQTEITRELTESYRRNRVEIFSHGIVEVRNTSTDLDGVHGLDHVIAVIRDVAAAMSEGDLQRVPRGLLFLGTPGTGRAMAAELLAGYGNMALVRLRNIREIGAEYTYPSGQEHAYNRSLKLAINFVQAIAPVVVLIDLDEAWAIRAGLQPSSQDSTLPIELLNAIDDPSLHGKVIWIGTSNRPDLMAPIFRRDGLFDHRLVFLPPTPAVRADIIEKFFRDAQIAVQHIDFGKIGTDGFTDGLCSSHLYVIVQRSYNIAKRNNRHTVTEADLIEAAIDFVPEFSPEMNEFAALLALREANSRSMIPAALPEEFQGFVAGNRINKTAINQRVIELAQQLGLEP